MNRHSKYYRLNPVKGKLGKVNHKVVGDIKYDTFRRFNSYNVATKHAILGAVGKLLDEMVREDVGDSTYRAVDHASAPSSYSLTENGKWFGFPIQ